MINEAKISRGGLFSAGKSIKLYEKAYKNKRMTNTMNRSIVGGVFR